MLDAQTIVDGKSLEAWLRSWPGETEEEIATARRVAVTVAHRAAMRVLPVFWAWSLGDTARDRDITALPVLRCALISNFVGVVPMYLMQLASDTVIRLAPGASIEDAGLAIAAAARAASMSAAAIGTDSSDFSHSASIALEFAAKADLRVAELRESVGQILAKALYSFDIWRYTQLDCSALSEGNDLGNTRLWLENDNPLQQTWDGIKRRLPQAGPNHTEETARGPVAVDWSFWVRWYEAALAGETLDPEMLLEIAEKDEAFWEGTAGEVNNRIEGIQLKYAGKATPNAERIVFNKETRKLRVEAASDLPAPRLEDIRIKMRDTSEIFDGEGGENGPYAGLMPEVQIVRRAADRNGARPMQLYDACRRAANRTRRKIELDECPRNDALVEDFLEQLDETRFDVIGANEDVREAVDARAEERLKDADPKEAEVLIEAADDFAKVSEGDLAEEMPEDARTVADELASPEERKDALYRYTSRAVRIYGEARKGLGEASGVSKDIGIVIGASTAVVAAIRYVLSLF